MELKQRIKNVGEDAVNGSNRTFMELKYYNGLPKGGTFYVLIVPLWN